jgi:hypothetical protein
MSIFDIEEKSNKDIDGAYLISNGWKLEYTNFFGWVYVKTIRHKTRPSRFLRLCYHHDTNPKRTLRNLNNRETIEVHDIMMFELQISEWITDWEETPILEYYNVQIF